MNPILLPRVLFGLLATGLVVGLLPTSANHRATAEEPKVSAVVGHLLPEEGGPQPTPASPVTAPFGIDFDSQGNMIIVELEGGRVHRLTPAGSLTRIAGDGSSSYQGDNGPAASATFNGMHNVAVTKQDQIYIADSWNHCVRRIDMDSGMISTVAGTGVAGYSGDGGPGRQATFDYVMCVTLNIAEDQLYLADLNNRRIRALDLKSGIVRLVAGNGETGIPADGALAVDSPLADPRAVAVDSRNNVYILERGGHALRVVSADGRIRTVAGTGQAGHADGPALTAQFSGPKHLCVDASDNVYIADDQNRAIRKYDPRQQLVTTILGRGQAAASIKLHRPHGVCIHDGILYVVDTGHDRILRIRE